MTTAGGEVDLQPRDMTYAVRTLDEAGMAYQVTATARSGAYRIVTDYVTDPLRDAVVMRVTFEPLVVAARADRLYLRLNPLLNGHGGGGAENAGAQSATVVRTADGPIPLDDSTSSATNAVNRTYAQPIYLAMAASRPFAAVSNGYAGTPSDGLTELEQPGHLTTDTPDAADGNVVNTVEAPLGRGAPPAVPPPPTPGTLGAYGDPANFPGPGPGCAGGRPPAAGARGPGVTPAPSGSAPASSRSTPAPSAPPAGQSSFTLALGFGSSERGAVSAALGAALTPFGTTLGRYEAQWHAYDAHLCRPPAHLPGVGPAELADVAGGTGSPRTC